MSKHLQSGQHPDADQISAFVDHALPAHAREEMLAHLAECTDCRETVALSLPAIESSPMAMRNTKPWFWDFRFLLPASAVALAVAVLYIHHGTNSRADVRRGPDIALERQAAPTEDRTVSSGEAGGGAGSTSFAGRVLEAPRKIPSARAAAPPKERSEAEANGLALDEAPKVVELHLPGGRIPITTVTRGLQVLAIDNRNQLFLSNDRGVSWLAVRVPWRGRAVRAELASFPVPAAPSQQALIGVGGGLGAGVGGGAGATPMNPSDAARLEKQKDLRQELKGSYKAAANGSSDSPSATPVPALTAPAPSAPSALQATLSGFVTDRSGAIIPSVSVVLTKQDDVASTTVVTGDDGRYHVDRLAPGTYQLEARAPGFNSTRISAIQIDASSSNTRNLVLDVGAASQTVAVQANAPETQLAYPGLGRNAISLKQKSASPNALARPTPVFEITTDSGDHWISSDGVNWQRR
jgi:hypothetical protein